MGQPSVGQKRKMGPAFGAKIAIVRNKNLFSVSTFWTKNVFTKKNMTQEFSDMRFRWNLFRKKHIPNLNRFEYVPLWWDYPKTETVCGHFTKKFELIFKTLGLRPRLFFARAIFARLRRALDIRAE